VDKLRWLPLLDRPLGKTPIRIHRQAPIFDDQVLDAFAHGSLSGVHLEFQVTIAADVGHLRLDAG
jgi:hypothetical protein